MLRQIYRAPMARQAALAMAVPVAMVARAVRVRMEPLEQMLRNSQRPPTAKMAAAEVMAETVAQVAPAA